MNQVEKKKMQKEIESELRNYAKNEEVHATSSNANHAIWVLVAVFLAIGIFGAAAVKLSKKGPMMVAQQPVQLPPQNIITADPQVSELKSEIASLRTELAALKEAAKTTDMRSRNNRDKIQVIGIITNENAIIAQNRYSPTDTMTINRHWRLDRHPKYLKLSENDMTYIDRLVLDNEKRGGEIYIEGEEDSLPFEAKSVQGEIPTQSNWGSSKLEKNVGLLNERLDKSETELKNHAKQLSKLFWESDEKIQVLAYVLNENSAIMKNNYPRQHVLSLTRDWGLSAWPRYCTLDDEAKRWLKLKKKEPLSTVTH